MRWIYSAKSSWGSREYRLGELFYKMINDYYINNRKINVGNIRWRIMMDFVKNYLIFIVLYSK